MIFGHFEQSSKPEMEFHEELLSERNSVFAHSIVLPWASKVLAKQFVQLPVGI